MKMRAFGMGIILLLGTASVSLRGQAPAKAETVALTEAGRANEIAGHAVSFSSPQVGLQVKPGSVLVLPEAGAKDPAATRSTFSVPSIPEPGVYAGLLGAVTFLVVCFQRARRRLA